MNGPVLARELEAIRESLAGGFRGVYDRLDTIDNRLRDTEGAARVLHDRSERDDARLTGIGKRLAKLDTEGCAVGRLLHGASAEGSWWTPKRTAGATVGGAGAVVALVEMAKAIIQAVTR